MTGANDDLKALIRTIPDFPKPGIQFRDITTLLLDATALFDAIERMATASSSAPTWSRRSRRADSSSARRSRCGSGCGLLLIRKDGKLPGETIAEDYALEYGTDRIAMHVDACAPGASVLLVDDLIATGGTALAAVRLLRRAGAIVDAGAVRDRPARSWRRRSAARGRDRVESLMEFEGD